MRLGTLLAVLVFITSPLFAQINFSDNFSSGLSPTYWTVTEIPSNTFTIDTSAGKLSLTADNALTSEYGGVYLSSSAFGIPVGGLTGNFSESLTFSSANISSVGSGNNINLDALFEGSADFFVDAYSTSDSQGAYVYGDVPSETGPDVATSASGGTFNISRNGSIVSGSFDGNLLFSVIDTSPLASLSFAVSSDNAADPASADFENFSFTNVPEPGILAMILLGLPLVSLRRRFQRS